MNQQKSNQEQIFQNLGRTEATLLGEDPEKLSTEQASELGRQVYKEDWEEQLAREQEQKRIHELCTQLQCAEEQAKIDPLTELLNRRGLEDHFANLQSHLERHQIPLAVLALDLDHFKEINDTFGHNAGDQVLQGVSRILQKNTRDNYDLVARFGGDEFVIILDLREADDPQQIALQKAEQLRRAIESLTFEIQNSNQTFQIICSFGLHTFNQAEKNAIQTIQINLEKADSALYQAKKGGRNRVVPTWEEEATATAA